MSDYNCTSSVTEMSHDLNCNILCSRRQTSRLCLVFKILHNLVDVTLPSYIIPSTRFTRDMIKKSFYPNPELICIAKFSFFPNLIRLCNNLPLETVHAHIIDKFCK